jgi:alkane 1-monooxygenase
MALSERGTLACTGGAAAWGYLSIFVVPGLLALSAWIDKPFLTIGAVLVVFPLARTVFGGYSEIAMRPMRESIALALHWLPWLYVLGLAGAIGTLLEHLAHAPLTASDVAGWALSLWATLLFATCVAHELLHRRSLRARRLGHALAGLTGYPLLGYEHNRHHRLAGSTAAAEWPGSSESVWRFAARRLGQLTVETLAPRGLAWAGNPREPAVAGLRIGLSTTVATGLLFGVVAGWGATGIYIAALCLVAFGIQLVTYMQHWGLGDDGFDDARARAWSWEHDCRLQAWVTLNLSFHQAHHREPQLPYYSTALAAGSPRLPAGYVLMMFAALVPALWMRVMRPVLARWRENPSVQASAGRRLVCTNAYGGK